MYCEAKKHFGAIRKILKLFIFGNLLHKKGLKGGISIDAYSGPLRYVMLWWYFSPARHFYSDWLWPYCVPAFNLKCNFKDSEMDYKNEPCIKFGFFMI